MRRANFDPTALQGDDQSWWKAWDAKSRAERTACCDARAAGEAYEFVEKIWKDLKEFLLRSAFHNKCGYCEGPVRAVSYGDADHYRPKKRVTTKVDGSAEEVTCDGGGKHPGYYWLAYDWENLVPACERCNRANAKMNQFPVAKRHSCTPLLDTPALNELEGPLLLNPHYESSGGTLVFGELGTVSPVNGNERGTATVQTCRLDREELETERGSAQETAWLQFTRALGGAPNEIDDVISEWEAGVRPYSRAALDYIRITYERRRPRIADD